MNFQQLIGRIGDLDKPVQHLKEEKIATVVKSELDLNAVKKLSGLSESTVEECGMGPGPMGAPMPPRDEPVTMNVTMNARGGESIRDLLDILKGKGTEDGGDALQGPKGVVIGTGGPGDIDIDEKYENEPEPEVMPVSDVIPTGDDMHSKGDEAEKVNGGGNPWAAREFDESAFKQQLKNLYQEVKNRQTNETMYDRPALRKASDEADFQKKMQQTTDANAADKSRRAQELADNNLRLRLAKIGQLKSFRPGMTDQEVSAMELAHKQKYGM